MSECFTKHINWYSSSLKQCTPFHWEKTVKKLWLVLCHIPVSELSASLSYPNGTNICNYKDIRNCKDVIRYPRYTRSDILYKVIRYQIFKLNFGSFTFSNSLLHLWFVLSFFFLFSERYFFCLKLSLLFHILFPEGRNFIFFLTGLQVYV